MGWCPATAGKHFIPILSEFAQETEIIVSWTTCHVRGLWLATTQKTLKESLCSECCHLQTCGIQVPTGRSGEGFLAWPYQPSHHKKLLYWLKSFYQIQAVLYGQMCVQHLFTFCKCFSVHRVLSLYPMARLLCIHACFLRGGRVVGHWRTEILEV